MYMRRKEAGYLYFPQKTRYIAAVAVLVATTELAATRSFIRLLGTKSMSSAEIGISAVLPRRRAFRATGSSCNPLGVRRSILVPPTAAVCVGPPAAATSCNTVTAPVEFRIRSEVRRVGK